jgi:hypothetical protein
MNRFSKISILLVVLVSTSLCSKAQDKVLTPEEMQALVFSQIKGYSDDGTARSKLIQIGNIQYSMCERKFISGKQKIRILLFDYKEASIMYNQATKVWQTYTPVITDSATLRPLWMTNCSGWESYRKSNNTSEVYLGICNRFFLNLTGEGVDLDKMKEVLGQFKFEQFPK